ncbi:unnamed protein product [Brassicogethes aeneus]|uniref:Peptidase M12B domain-containing protein n=1 Tax=Brassicogethes aeneus TaxID=1431903 RepID=A0A9P0FFM4_BRAAE|nr:unnamed protein product [Brassicogethes aeneus]
MSEPELVYYFETDDFKNVPEYEVVFLPSIISHNEAIGEYEVINGNEEIPYSFNAFKRTIDLKLRKNLNLISPSFTTYMHYGNDQELYPEKPNICHYIHNNDGFVASVSLCEPKTMEGLIFLNNTTLEVRPLNDRLQSVIKTREALTNDYYENLEEKNPHIIKRATFKSEHLINDIFPITNIHHKNMIKKRDFFHLDREASRGKPVGALQLELALFFDEAAYKIFAPYVNRDDKKILDLLLAYVNGVQALYHHPSLGTNLELVLVRLDIMKKQPPKLPHYNGERGRLLDSFCSYQASLNPKGDGNPKHWDMGLYVSGLDFYHIENGKKSGVTMGLATVGGVCLDKYACLIAELGTTNVFKKPYPSAGFTSVYILAHEIGHNLGMHHDSTGNNCLKDGFIMSPSRGTNGETTWSSCSANVMSNLNWADCLTDWGSGPKLLDHSKFSDTPGRFYTAKRQCEILLRDRDAIMSPNQQLNTICYNLQCKTPNRSGYYFAGPALDGTQCGLKQYCYGGDCVTKQPKPVKIVPGGWSAWKPATCSSGCVEKSLGYQMKKRFCNNPTPVNTDEGCEGSSIEFGLCYDGNLCTSKESVIEYASKKCKEFSNLVLDLDQTGAGLQAPHEEARVWMGCAIFCKRADSKSYYTPRIELNDLGVSPYFPDGTWCHKSNNINYYCLHHHCLPEHFQFTKFSSILKGIGEDIPFSQNAHPQGPIIPEIVKSYHSLNPDGLPVQKTFTSNELKQLTEDAWETNDYIEVPELKERYRLRNAL